MILVDMERQRYPHSGLGFYCRCLERGLREVAKDLPLRYYRPGKAGEKDVVSFRPWHRWLNWNTRSVELIHITHQNQHYLPSSPSSRIILTLHDLNFLREYAPNSSSYRRRLQEVRGNIARADLIVCISEFVRQDLLTHRELFDLREGARIEVVYNGIIFDGGAGVAPERMPCPEGSYLLCIGVLFEKKQQHLLVEMLRFLPEEMHLVLVYSDEKPEYRALLNGLIEKYHLTGRVHLMPRVTAQVKQYLLRHCLGLALPSIAEGFGIPPVEAMSLGKPVFLSRATSLSEIGGEWAFYFDSPEPEAMAEAVGLGLQRYADTPDYPERLRLWAGQYDYRVMAENYANLYRSLLR